MAIKTKILAGLLLVTTLGPQTYTLPTAITKEASLIEKEHVVYRSTDIGKLAKEEQEIVLKSRKILHESYKEIFEKSKTPYMDIAAQKGRAALSASDTTIIMKAFMILAKRTQEANPTLIKKMETEKYVLPRDAATKAAILEPILSFVDTLVILDISLQPNTAEELNDCLDVLGLI